MLLRRALSTVTRRNNVSVFSIPINFGQPLAGVDRAPELMFQNGLVDALATLNWNAKRIPDIVSSGVLTDEKALPEGAKARNCAEVGVVCEKAYKAILEEARTDDFMLMLGGDHCIPIGTISAIKEARKDVGIVWVDAHADINTPYNSGSGNIHGMPLSFLLGLVKNAAAFPKMGWFKPCLKPSDIVYIGLRDVDGPEQAAIKDLGIKAFTMREVDKYGIGGVMTQVTEYFKDRKNIHLSYDIDALDPFYAPSTGTAVRGGLTFREGSYICEELYSTGKLTSMDLVEVNPSLSTNTDAKQTVEMAVKLVRAAMGHDILERNNRHVPN